MNTRFATAVHILTLLNVSEAEWMSSSHLAGSINIHPVIVRKEIARLVLHGLVESKEGKGGGCRLAKPASRIRIADIYAAVLQEMGRSNQPNPACRIGKQINRHLDQVYAQMETALMKQLGRQTLAEFTAKFK